MWRGSWKETEWVWAVWRLHAWNVTTARPIRKTTAKTSNLSTMESSGMAPSPMVATPKSLSRITGCFLHSSLYYLKSIFWTFVRTNSLLRPFFSFQYFYLFWNIREIILIKYIFVVNFFILYFIRVPYYYP